MQNHNFYKSKKIENNTTNLHDIVYKSFHFDNIKLVDIDRKSCEYKTKTGKQFQQDDTDLILTFFNEKTNKHISKKVSEKTRTKFYNDLFIEVISILKFQPTTQRYEFKTEGWGTKLAENGPDYLSVVFKEQNQFNSIFLPYYKKLKEEIFIKSQLKDILSQPEFVNWLNDKILNASGKKHFTAKYDFKDNIKHTIPVKSVVFALNNNYYTIGFTYSLKDVQKIVKVVHNKFNILENKLKP